MPPKPPKTPVDTGITGATMSPLANHEEGAVRRVSVSNPEMDVSIVHEAAAATENERNMGLLQSLKLYRKACLWSVAISTCIVM